MKTYHLTPLVCTLLFFLVANAQPVGEFDKTAELYSFSCDATTSSFKIQGTSSLHDWEMTSQACKGSVGIFPLEQTLNIAEITVEVSVNSLKSGKKVMDKKCYDALKLLASRKSFFLALSCPVGNLAQIISVFSLSSMFPS